VDDDAAAPDQGPAPFRIGFVPGVIVSKWTRTWAERFPDRPLEVIRTEQADQCEALRTGRLDACFARLPLDGEDLSAIPLYTEAAVVVVPADHPLAETEEVSVIDLVDEDLLQDPETVPQWRDAAAELRTAEPPATAQTSSTADAVALVAAGLGVLILPMSVARTYRRRDVRSLPVSDVDGTRIALAWPTDHTTDDVERLIGIVRGRTVNSSRGPAARGTDTKTDATTAPATPAGRPRPAKGRGAAGAKRRGSR
jgi:DNA-binding transcriptional LysR family regulator